MFNLDFNEYMMHANKRLPDEARKVLHSLHEEKMNKEDLSLSAGVKRAVLDHIIMQLYALGLVDITNEGKSKICQLTKLGNEFLMMINGETAAS